MKKIISILAVFTIGFIACKKTSTAPAPSATTTTVPDSVVVPFSANVYCVYQITSCSTKVFLKCSRFNTAEELAAAVEAYRPSGMIVDFVSKPTCADCN